VVTIIDYGAGNLRSVANAVARLGYRVVVTDSPEQVMEATAVVLPGVGAAGDTAHRLEALGMSEAIRRLVSEDRPLLAICVGMQVLFDGTEEGGWHKCLGLLPGAVRRLPPGRKVPHMGWNQVRQAVPHPVFDGVPDGADFYFVHSYYAAPEDPGLAAAFTEYGVDMCSMVIKSNLVATQFHPEKSGRFGLKMYDNFLRMALGEHEGGRNER